MNRRIQAARYSDAERFNRLPECIEEFLDYGTAVSCAFNSHGTLLATGTDIGYIGIWDFETRGLAKTLPVDSQPEPLLVTCVAWSANGRYLLSGHSKPDKGHSDKTEKVKASSRIILWDVLTGKQLAEVPMPSPVTRVCLTPRKPFAAVVSLRSGPPLVVDLAQEQPTVTPLDSVDLKAVLEGVAPRQRSHGEPAAPVALLSRCGRQVYVTAQQAGKGFLMVYDLDSKQLLDLIKLPAAVSSMSLNKQGSHLLLNCVDKVVRLADVRPPPPGTKPVSKEAAEDALRAAASTQTSDAPVSLLPGGGNLVSLIGIAYQLSVEREMFVGAVFTHDNQHVACGSTSTAQHRIYLWVNGGAHLVSVLEGPRNDGVLDMAWHPHSNMMVTVSTMGKVYVWAQIYNEEWSAFAPDFKELHENEEYVEQEDEFDIKPPEPSYPDGAPGDVRASARIDIVTRAPRGGSDMEVDESDDEEKLVTLVGEIHAGDAPAADVDKDGGEEQRQSDGDASDDEEEEAGPGASGRTGEAGGESDGGGTDQPRKRKAVRFEQYDDKAFEDLMRMQEDHLKNQANKPTTSTGRRGRPPIPRPKEPEH